MLIERKTHFFLAVLFIVTATVPIRGDNGIKWTTKFELNDTKVQLHMHDTLRVNVTLSGLNVADLIATNASINIVSDDNVLEVIGGNIPLGKISELGQWSGSFDVSATFLGRAQVNVRIVRNGITYQSPESLAIIIIREERLVDKLFTASVATLVSILYINFGAALDVQKVRAAFVRPIGPSIALFCHFLLLPVVSSTTWRFFWGGFFQGYLSLTSRRVMCWVCYCFLTVLICSWACSSLAYRQLVVRRIFGRFFLAEIWSCPLRWRQQAHSPHSVSPSLNFVSWQITAHHFLITSHSAHSDDAILDLHSRQNHIRPCKHSRPVPTDFNVRHCTCGSARYRFAHSALLPALSPLVGAHTENLLIAIDSIHCDFRHLHQPVSVQIVHVGGEPPLRSNAIFSGLDHWFPLSF